jgi:hypothetical protein
MPFIQAVRSRPMFAIDGAARFRSSVSNAVMTSTGSAAT